MVRLLTAAPAVWILRWRRFLLDRLNNIKRAEQKPEWVFSTPNWAWQEFRYWFLSQVLPFAPVGGITLFPTGSTGYEEIHLAHFKCDRQKVCSVNSHVFEVVSHYGPICSYSLNIFHRYVKYSICCVMSAEWFHF